MNKPEKFVAMINGIELPDTDSRYRWEAVTDDRISAKPTPWAPSPYPYMNPFAPSPYPYMNPFAPREQEQEVRVEADDGSSTRLVLASERHPWHRLWHQEFEQWVDVEMQVVIQQQAGGFVQRMQVMPTEPMQRLLEAETRRRNRMSYRLQQARARAAQAGVFIDEAVLVHDGKPSEDDFETRPPRMPEGKTRDQNKREQLQRQRQHSKRHNGR